MASSLRSTSVSTRLTKNDATLCTSATLPPPAANASSPDTYASMISSYRSRLNSNVMLMLRPSLIICRTAGTPLAVPGIFTYRLGWSMRSCSSRAAAMLLSVSRARFGASSMDTKPSSPPLSSWTARRMSSAAEMSATTIDQYARSTLRPCLASDRNCSS